MINAQDFLVYINTIASLEYNSGYSNEQEKRRVAIEKKCLNKIETKFPEIKDRISIGNFSGLGYYSAYSDFKIMIDNIPIIGVGNHTHTIEIARYRAEWYPKYDLDEIFEGINIDTCTIDELVNRYKQYYNEKKINKYSNEIKKLNDKIIEQISLLKELGVDTKELEQSTKKINDCCVNM
jgi:hypothetical protein